ncbi:MAG: rod shape-determining protein MreC [Candidatus Marinimicrobia bacterium]|nr:rod shape-determining protein MreC [Candidatus Neomarinimicrobiota bacterium]
MFKAIYDFCYDFAEYLLFGILILLAFILIFSGDSPQVHKLQGNISDTFAFLTFPKNFIKKTTNLIQENHELRRENLQLRRKNADLMDASKENQRYEKMLGFQDSIDFVVVPARVINYGNMSVGKALMLNVGTKAGIQKLDPVICPEGIVGKVVSVGDKTAIVHVFNDINFRLSIRFMDSRLLGILRPIGSGMLQVSDIPTTAVIHPGEQVVTSGFSDIYPPNIRVGVVDEIQHSETKNYQIATVKPYVQLKSLEEVFVILDY